MSDIGIFLDTLKKEFSDYVSSQPRKSQAVVDSLKEYLDSIKVTYNNTNGDIYGKLNKDVIRNLTSLIDVSEFLTYLTINAPFSDYEMQKYIESILIKYDFGKDLSGKLESVFLKPDIKKENFIYEILKFYEIEKRKPINIKKTIKTSNVEYSTPNKENLKYHKSYDSNSYGVVVENGKALTISPFEDDGYFIEGSIKNLKKISEEELEKLLYRSTPPNDMDSLIYIERAKIFDLDDVVEDEKVFENLCRTKTKEHDLKNYYSIRKGKTSVINKKKESNSMIANLRNVLSRDYIQNEVEAIITDKDSVDLASITEVASDMTILKAGSFRVNNNGTISFFKPRIIDKNTSNLYQPYVPLSTWSKDYSFSMGLFKGNLLNSIPYLNAERAIKNRQNLDNPAREKFNNFAVYALLRRGPDFAGNSYMGMFTLETEDDTVDDFSSITSVATGGTDKLPTDYKKVLDTYYIRLQDFNIPGIATESYNLDFCGMKIAKLQSTLGESHTITLSFPMDEKGLLLQRFNVLSGKLPEFKEQWSTDIHDSNKKQYEKLGVSNTTSEYLAETYFPMSFFNNPNKKRLVFTVIYNDFRKYEGDPSEGTGSVNSLQKMLFNKNDLVKNASTGQAIGSMDSYRGFILEDVKILGDTNGIQFNRDSAGKLTLSIEILFKRITSIDRNIMGILNQKLINI